MKVTDTLHVIHTSADLLGIKSIFGAGATFSVWTVGEDILSDPVIETLKTSTDPIASLLDRYSNKCRMKLVFDACMPDLYTIMCPLIRFNDISYDPHDRGILILQVHADA